MECLRWGILGLGVPNGRKIAVAMERSRNSVLLAVAGAEVAEWCDEEELEAVTQYTTYEELLCDPRVDAVYVGVCTRLRSAWCVRAAESGKHLLVEKPLARSARSVRNCESLRRAGRLTNGRDGFCAPRAKSEHGVSVKRREAFWRTSDAV